MLTLPNPSTPSLRGLAAMSLLLGMSLQSGGAVGQPAPDLDASGWLDAGGWLARASARVRSEEYRFTALGPESWSAPNRAQGLRCRVGPCGIEVFERSSDSSGSGATWTLRLSTILFGRVGAVQAVESATVSAVGERIELDHGAFVEWFVNTEHGIEQGWTIEQRPAGRGLLALGLSLGSDLALSLVEGARSATLVDASGRERLRYGDLVAWDATGRELGLQLVGRGVGAVIELDDTHAEYPITIDPLITSRDWAVESGQAGAALGSSVASAGDVNGDGYDDVIVGAAFYDNGELNEGRAYVYHGSPSGLSTTPAWTAESNAIERNQGVQFGFSVASAGDVNGDGFSDVIVGAPGFDFSRGRAYLYLGSPSGLSPSEAWGARGGRRYNWFGTSVASAGDVNGDGYSDVIIGAWGFDGSLKASGGAFAYYGSPAGLSLDYDWGVDIAQVGAAFGISVSTAGDVNADGYSDVIVGASAFNNGEISEGAAFVYHGSAAGLGASEAWQVEANVALARMGNAVSTAGDVNGDGYSDVIVGAFTYTGTKLSEGRAYAYHGSAVGLELTPAWSSVPNNLQAKFGNSVAHVGDVNGDGYSDVLIGAPGYRSPEIAEGRALLYNGSATGLVSTAAWTDESNQVGAQLGHAVAGAGDVNGDGYPDIIIGAVGYSGSQLDEGQARAYYLSALNVAVVYCTAGTSATGCVTHLLGSGVASATAASGFTITASGAKGAKDGVLFLGTSGRQALAWGNGTSFQCVVPPLQRTAVLAGSGDPNKCKSVLAQDLNALWCPTCPRPALNPGAGTRVQGQVWFSDPFNTSNRSSALSDALEFLIAP